MQSGFIHTLPSPPKPQQNIAYPAKGQGGPLYSGAVHTPQPSHRHPGGQWAAPLRLGPVAHLFSTDSYQFQDYGAIPSQVQAYNGGTTTQQQWFDSSRPAQEHMQSWLPSAASSNPPPPSYAPASSYDPHIYGPMPGGQHPSVGPSPHRGSLADMSMWGVRYNQSGITQGQASKPPLPVRCSRIHEDIPLLMT